MNDDQYGNPYQVTAAEPCAGKPAVYRYALDPVKPRRQRKKKSG